jgi:hypothetical protein
LLYPLRRRPWRSMRTILDYVERLTTYTWCTHSLGLLQYGHGFSERCRHGDASVWEVWGIVVVLCCVVLLDVYMKYVPYHTSMTYLYANELTPDPPLLDRLTQLTELRWWSRTLVEGDVHVRLEACTQLHQRLEDVGIRVSCWRRWTYMYMYFPLVYMHTTLLIQINAPAMHVLSCLSILFLPFILHCTRPMIQKHPLLSHTQTIKRRL